MAKRTLGIILMLCMLLSAIVIPVTVVYAADTDTQEVAADYGLADDVQDGQILQIWNWSFNNATKNMQKIAEQGFTAIQTSPIQQAKEGTTGRAMQTNWWVLYQPAWFHIDNTGSSALGNKSDFEKMCAEAEKYGIKVIVDAVLNHTGNQSGNDISSAVDPELKNNSSCWHDVTRDTGDYNNRWEITQLCMGGLPDLNTANSIVQNKAKAFLNECIDAGADGFRYDGAKHIEVPNDGNHGSNFWPTVINSANSHASSKGIDLYHYGEVLDKTAGGQYVTDQYTQYMSVTLNGVGNDIRHNVQSRNANGAKRSDFSYSDASVAANKAVVWNESHDTYANAGESRWVSTQDLNRTWAIVGTRQSCGMYFARPNNYGDAMGSAAVNGWANPEVAAINHFNNAFAGQTDYVSSNGSIVAVERGTTGVVLTNVGGGGSTSVNMKMNRMKDGTYKDEITGATFTVSGGNISGQIGSTGIAVVYDAQPIVPVGPSASATPGTSSYKTDSLQVTLSLSNATSGQYSIDGGSFQSFTNGQKITVGSGKAFGTVTTLEVKATGTDAEPSKTYKYTKVDPSQVQRVYFDNSSYNWSTVYCYIYNDVDGGGGTDPDPTDPTDPGTTIKFTDSMNWGNVNAYFFGTGGTVGAEWPGSPMTTYEQNNMQIDIPSGATHVIFNNGSAQTVDLPLSGVVGYYLDGSQTDGKYNGTAWDASAMETSATDDLATGDMSQPDTTPANAPWPGVQMTLDSETGFYVTDVPEGFENGYVVFTEGETATTNRYPADKEPGLALEGNTMKFSAGNAWDVYTSSTTKPTETTPEETEPEETTPPPADDYMVGDANGDGKVNVQDVLDIQKHISAINELTGDKFSAADVNSSNTVNVQDALEIQKYIGNYATSYPIGQYA